MLAWFLLLNTVSCEWGDILPSVGGGLDTHLSDCDGWQLTGGQLGASAAGSGVGVGGASGASVCASGAGHGE